MRTFRALILALVIVFIASPFTAWADDEIELAPGPAVTTDPTTNAATQPVVSCSGVSNNPHVSGHVPGTVNAVVTTSCPAVYPVIYAQATLYLEGFYASQGSAYGGIRRTASANAADDCPGYSALYAVNGYHWVKFPNGSDGYGYTDKSAFVNC